MTDRARYVAALLERYRRLPGTLGRVLRDDQRTAAALHDRRIDLDVVHQAFVIALARRAFCADADRLEPIRTLRYFLPAVDEIVHNPPDSDYLQYLQHKLRDAGLHLPHSHSSHTGRSQTPASVSTPHAPTSGRTGPPNLRSAPTYVLKQRDQTIAD